MQSDLFARPKDIHIQAVVRNCGYSGVTSLIAGQDLLGQSFLIDVRNGYIRYEAARSEMQSRNDNRYIF